MTETVAGGRAIAPVRKQLWVPVSAARAFEAFTADTATWWPLDSHSVFGEDAVGVVFGRAVGAPIIETSRTGETATWGMVLAWEPPGRIVFSWHPGASESVSTEVEVTFAGVEGGTMVTLEHRAWERRLDGAVARGGYDTGWTIVLGSYQVTLGGGPPVEVLDTVAR